MNITKQRLNQIIQEELQTMIDYETSKWMGKPQRYSTDRGISLRATQDHEDDVDRYAQQSAKDANERRHYRERPPGADHAARKPMRHHGHGTRIHRWCAPCMAAMTAEGPSTVTTMNPILSWRMLKMAGFLVSLFQRTRQRLYTAYSVRRKWKNH